MSVRNKPALLILEKEEEKFKRELLLRCRQLDRVNLGDAGALQALFSDIKETYRIYEMSSTALSNYYSDKGRLLDARNVRQERHRYHDGEVAECLKLINLHLQELEYETLSGLDEISHQSLVRATGSEAAIPGSTKGIDAAEAPIPAQYQNVAGAEATIPDPTTVPSSVAPHVAPPPLNVSTNPFADGLSKEYLAMQRRLGKSIRFSSPLHTSTPFHPGLPILPKREEVATPTFFTSNATFPELPNFTSLSCNMADLSTRDNDPPTDPPQPDNRLSIAPQYAFFDDQGPPLAHEDLLNPFKVEPPSPEPLNPEDEVPFGASASAFREAPETRMLRADSLPFVPRQRVIVPPPTAPRSTVKPPTPLPRTSLSHTSPYHTPPSQLYQPAANLHTSPYHTPPSQLDKPAANPHTPSLTNPPSQFDQPADNPHTLSSIPQQQNSQATFPPSGTFPPNPLYYPTQAVPYAVYDHGHYERLRDQLKRGSKNPYSGDVIHYSQWKILLLRRMAAAHMRDPLDQIESIIADLQGDLQTSVKNCLAAGIRDPARALQTIWSLLEERCGSDHRYAEKLEIELKRLPMLKDPIQLDVLHKVIDTCRVAASAIPHSQELQYLNTARGITIVLDKMPPRYRSKWATKHVNFEKERGIPPNFTNFVDFLAQEAVQLNLPYFHQNVPTARTPSSRSRYEKRSLATKAEGQPSLEGSRSLNKNAYCVLHEKGGHNTVACPDLQGLDYPKLKQIASDHRLCFNCLKPHYAADCSYGGRCGRCGRTHITLMHRPYDPNFNQGYSSQWEGKPVTRRDTQDKIRPWVGGRGRASTNRYQPGKYVDTKPPEQPPEPPPEPKVNDTTVKNTCTLVCGKEGKSKICSKTVLVDITHRDIPGSMRGYCIVDEQSNASFCDQSVVDFFDPPTFAEDYSIITMNGCEKVQGVSVPGISIKGAQETQSHPLPPIFTHPNLPDTTAEVATRDVVKAHPHIASLARHFPKYVGEYPTLLLIGADCGSLMRSETLGDRAPYIHRTPLGYTVVGPVCPQVGERGPLKALCTSLQVSSGPPSSNLRRSFTPNYSKVALKTPFETREDDELKGYSQENLLFMDIINEGVTINEKGNIQMPIPMRPGAEVPKNRSAVLGRTISTLNRLKKNDKKLESCLTAFGEYLSAGHVEEVPPPQPSSTPNQVCYLPIFPVFNPHKERARLVLDPSLVTEGKSLNNALLPGPDETNKLAGVLIRFRVGEIGFSADVEKMFHAFYVCEEQRDLLRFFWYQNNCPSRPIVEYRSNVMIFGSKSSPSCATFGLRYAAMSEKGDDLPASRDFLLNNVYIDDALGSADTVEDAIKVLKGSVDILGSFNIRLHKINASSTSILEALPSSELAESVTPLPTLGDARTLGLVWRPQEDTLGIASNLLQRPFTRRGVLGVVHATFDPLGLASPSLLKGKLLLREIMPQKGKSQPVETQYDWDDPLPDHYRAAWDEWKASLEDVCLIQLPRSYKPPGFGEVSRREIHCFCDASKEAIGFVLYLISVNAKGERALSFLYASSKVSPRSAETIPRLELCAGVDAVQTTIKIIKELKLPIDSQSFYTDSLVVLGYLNNTGKRFSRYVARRVEAILQLSSTEEWHHIAGTLNVGDIASRPHPPRELLKTDWLTGPPFLLQGSPLPQKVSLPDDLPETSKEVSALLTISQPPTHRSLPNEVVKGTNSWAKAVSAVGVYLQLGRILLKREKYEPAVLTERSSKVLIREAQQEFSPQIALLRDSKPLPGKDRLASLSPFLDQSEVLRVGGRLSNSDFPPDVKNPILLPPKHPITQMIISHFHQEVKHQGRVLTHGAIRQAGFHILSGSKVIKLFLANCVNCRRVRGKPVEQMMASLPKERLETLAPFDHVGIDFFGPYFVHDGRNTRRSNASKKVWVMLVTCLASRACHVEVVPSMDTSSFELSLRRFLALRGKVTSIVSDQGSNFKGALNESLDFSQLQKVSAAHGVKWSLNPPLASNFGGVFERKIGAIKSVFNATLQLLGKRDLSRDEFTTLIVEATAIVNSTPLWEVSNNPDDPSPLSPAKLLTLKDNPHPPPVDTFAPTDLLQYGKRRWRRVMYLAEQFWIRWQRFYVAELQDRRKWTIPHRNLSVGDIVLLKGKTKRNQWPLGRVIEAKVSGDGLVRRVLIKVGSAKDRPPISLERSVRDTVLVLPTGDPSSE